MQLTWEPVGGRYDAQEILDVDYNVVAAVAPEYGPAQRNSERPYHWSAWIGNRKLGVFRTMCEAKKAVSAALEQLVAGHALGGDDDDIPPTPEEIQVTLNKILGVAHLLRHNALGWEEEGEPVEARRYRKHADKIDAAFVARDATSLEKLTSLAGMTKALGHKPEPNDTEFYLTSNELDRLRWGWAQR